MLGKLMQPSAAWLSAAILAGSRNHPGAQLSHTVSLRSRPSASRTIQAPMRSPRPVAGGGSQLIIVSMAALLRARSALVASARRAFSASGEAFWDKVVAKASGKSGVTTETAVFALG